MRVLTAVIAVLIVLIGANSMFTVREGQYALLLQFGRIERADFKPGLHFKWPLVQQVLKFDARLLNLNSQPERYYTAEKKSAIVDFYVKWRIDDVSKFYTSFAGDETQATQRLLPIIKDALRFEFNARPLAELISGGRTGVTGPVRDKVNKTTEPSLGIQIVDVRIKRIDLPDQVSESVYSRMRAERQKLANELRSTGKEEAEKIKADADRQRQVLLADANQAAQTVRGEGDAKAAEIYAAAYGKDPDFFNFYRSLQAYRDAFKQPNGVMVLDPKSEFLHYLQSSGK